MSEETTVQMLGRLLEEALQALADQPTHIVTRSGYCAKCEGGCLLDFGKEPVPFVAHPWDAVAARDRSIKAAKDYARLQGRLLADRGNVR